jgi:hypothetical protein
MKTGNFSLTGQQQLRSKSHLMLHNGRDSLSIRHSNLAHAHIQTIFTSQSFKRDIKMQLPHAAEQQLACNNTNDSVSTR